MNKLKDIKNLNDIDTDTKEGRLVMAMLAKITTEYEPNKTPGEVLLDNVEFAKQLFEKGGILNNEK